MAMVIVGIPLYVKQYKKQKVLEALHKRIKEKQERKKEEQY